MRRRIGIKPSRPMSCLAAAVGLAILLIGGGAIFSSGNFHPFFALWILVAIIVVGYHLYNAVSDDAPAIETAVLEEEDPPVVKRTPADRLRDLDDLHKEGLISEEEYNRKREELIKQI